MVGIPCLSVGLQYFLYESLSVKIRPNAEKWILLKGNRARLESLPDSHKRDIIFVTEVNIGIT